jgi:hypothetical protein
MEIIWKGTVMAYRGIIIAFASRDKGKPQKTPVLAGI